MFRLVAFYESRAGTAVKTALAALEDDHVSVNDDNLTVPGDTPFIVAVWSGASVATAGLLTQSQLMAPSMDYELDLASQEQIAAAGVLEASSPTPLNVFVDCPIQLTGGEMLKAYQAASSTNTAKGLVLVWLSDGNYARSPGKVDHIRATATKTLVANEWTPCVLTLDQELAKGTYELIGLRAESAGAVAARVLFSNQGARPGVIAYDSPADIENPLFRNGNMGVMGRFEANAPPKVDMLSDSADTAETFILDIVKVA